MTKTIFNEKKEYLNNSKTKEEIRPTILEVYQAKGWRFRVF